MSQSYFFSTRRNCIKFLWTEIALLAPRSRAQSPAPRMTLSALVIGNARYESSPLKNSVNDARLLARTLKQIGYNVTTCEDAKRSVMLHQITSWLEVSARADVRIFYFAGHGAQYRGRNFLLPVDIELQAEEDLLSQAVDAFELSDKISKIRYGVNLVIYDACRDTPFPFIVRSVTGRSRAVTGSLSPGFAPTVPPQGTLIAYSTSPGSVAYDGKQDYGIYAKHLAKYILMPSIQIEDVFKRVRLEVSRETSNRQIPWESSSLIGNFCLSSGGQSCGMPGTSSPAGAIDLGRL